MGNCNTCTCNDKGEIQTFEVNVSGTADLSNNTKSQSGAPSSVSYQ